MRRAVPLIFLALLGALIGVGGSVTFGAFSNTTANPGNAVAADRIYAAPRSTTAWGVTDAASGTPTDVSDPVALDDDRYLLTKSLPASFNANNYIEIDLAGPLPAGISAQSATFQLDFADERNGNNDEVCAYFDVRRASTGAVLATRGGPAAPIGCEARRNVLRTSTALPEVSTSTIANDLRIRIYAAHTGSGQMRLHRATVNVTAAGNTWTLDEVRLDDRADGTPSSSPWSLALADGNELRTDAWATGFATNRYLELRFPAGHVPAGASVSSAALSHRYRPESAGRTFCYWLEVYSGTTLIGTHGSAGSPLACSSSGSPVTETTNLPGVAQAGSAAALSVRLYGRSSPAGASLHDLVSLSVTYSLPAGG